MCGRFVLISDLTRIAGEFNLAVPNIELPAQGDISPGQDCFCLIRKAAGAGGALLHWGITPPWAKDKSAVRMLINARAETVAEKPTFQQAWRERRCLIIANGFYEWSKEKKPYLFRFRDNRPFGMAGIYGKTPAAGGEKASFAIITTAANEIVAPVHDRMPVIIPAAACEEWLGNKPSSSQQLSRLLKPYPAELLGGCEVQLKKVSSRKTEKQLERK